VSVRRGSRGRRPRLLSTKPVARVGDPGRPRPSDAATMLAPLSCWLGSLVSALITLFIVSCANFAPPPAVSPALIANALPDHVDAGQLQNGRRLFVSHCLECHTLPRVTKYNREQWPHLVSRMSGLANLSAGEEAAIVAYLRAASLTRH
jgi:cytochrome c1